MTPDRDELREKAARALREHMFGGIEEPIEGGWLLMADAVLAVLPQYEQVGWLVDLGTRLTMRCRSYEEAEAVPVYIVREAEG